jgi:predicted metalloendopeptidase
VPADDVQQPYQFESDIGKRVAPGDDFWQYALGSWLGEQATREELRRLFLGWAQAWKSNRDLAIYYKKMDGKDVHAQYPVRVNGQVSLISDWYELFDVREGQKLYVAPEKRFYIW